MTEKIEELLEAIGSNICLYKAICIVAIICILLLVLIIIKKYIDEKESRDILKIIMKTKSIELLVFIVIFALMAFILNVTFSIDFLKSCDYKNFWSIIFAILMLKSFWSGRELYYFLNYNARIRETKKEIDGDIKLENIMERHQSNYLLEKEKLEILKSLTPISIIPLLAGFVLKGESLSINWNWYTVIFLGALFLYFYSLWKSYKNIKFCKYKEIEIKQELRDLINKKENNSSDNKNIKNKD